MDDRDIYNRNRVLPVAAVQAADPRALTDSPDTLYAVTSEGFMSRVVDVSDAALREVCRIASHAKSGDDWTPQRVHKHITYTWLRLLEQRKVLMAKAAGGVEAAADPSSAISRLRELGYSQYVVMVHTGLFDSAGREVCLLATQQMGAPRPYIVLKDGVRVPGGRDKVFDRVMEVLALPDVSRTGDPSTATFFAPRDPRLLYDFTKEVVSNDRHIVSERLNRLILAGLVDAAEGVVWRGELATAPMPPVGVASWQEEWVTEPGGVSGSSTGLGFGAGTGTSRRVRWCFGKRADGSFQLRRGNIGLNAVARQVRDWIARSVTVAKRNYRTAVPQFYYQPRRITMPSDGGPAGGGMPMTHDVYVGKLQLLLPVYSTGDEVVAALSIEYRERAPTAPDDDVGGTAAAAGAGVAAAAGAGAGDEADVYVASTFLPLDWALGNARLLTTPQVPWISKGAHVHGD